MFLRFYELISTVRLRKCYGILDIGMVYSESWFGIEIRISDISQDQRSIDSRDASDSWPYVPSHSEHRQAAGGIALPVVAPSMVGLIESSLNLFAACVYLHLL